MERKYKDGGTLTERQLEDNLNGTYEIQWTLWIAVTSVWNTGETGDIDGSQKDVFLRRANIKKHSVDHIDLKSASADFTSALKIHKFFCALCYTSMYLVFKLPFWCALPEIVKGLFYGKLNSICYIQNVDCVVNVQSRDWGYSECLLGYNSELAKGV